MTKNKSIEERIKPIIIDQLGVTEDKISLNTSFVNDLGADSLDTVELVMAFEEEFKDELEGEIPESEAEKLQTVKDVIRYIDDKIKK